jgi:hypothetical protein
MKLSLMIHTASTDNFLQLQGIRSYFDALIANLRTQTFQDFEFIYVDTYHEENQARFSRVIAGLPFQVKHVPVHKDHRYWYDRGHCYIAAAKNTGILHADGELLVTCDDAEFFQPHFLQGYWEHYRGGHYAHALHKRLRSIERSPEYPLPRFPVSGDTYVNDHRWEYVRDGLYIHQHGSLCFAGTSFSLNDALLLNGYNERMDGCKSLDDCDFGNRLRLLGRSFVLDSAIYVYILDHGSYAHDINCNWPDEVGEGQETPQPPVIHKTITNLVAVENNGLLRCGSELLDIVANKDPLTPQHYEIIRAETIKHQKFDPLAPEHAEKLKLWQGTPTFNLTRQWEELRRSPDWKWK